MMDYSVTASTVCEDAAPVEGHSTVSEITADAISLMEETEKALSLIFNHLFAEKPGFDPLESPTCLVSALLILRKKAVDVSDIAKALQRRLGA